MISQDQSIILKKFPLFSDLSDEEYHELNVSDNYKEAKKGEYIYFEAYEHKNIYFLKTGRSGWVGWMKREIKSLKTF